MAMITIRVKLPLDCEDIELEVDGNIKLMPFQYKFKPAFEKMLKDKLGFTPEDMKECQRDLRYVSALPESETPSFEIPLKEISGDFRAVFEGNVLLNKMNQKRHNSLEYNFDLEQMWDSITLELEEKSSKAVNKAEDNEPKLTIGMVNQMVCAFQDKIDLFRETSRIEIDQVFGGYHLELTKLHESCIELSEDIAKIAASQPETSRFALIKFLDLIGNREEEGSHIKREHLRKLGLEPPQVKAIMEHRSTTTKVIQELNLTDPDENEVRRLGYLRVVIREVIDKLSEGVLKSAFIKAYEAFFERLFLE